MKFEHKDYPSFFKNFDRYSLEGQQTYLKWIRVELIVLIIASLISLFPLDNTIYGKYLAISSAFVFSLGIGITFYIKNSKFEDDWYIGRALAESIKSLTWKYLTKGEPFGTDSSNEEIDRKFIELIKELLKENKSFLKVSYKEDDGINITNRMREIRSLNFSDRKSIYVQERVKNQQEWYKTKSNFNKEQSSILFWTIIIFQTLALIYSLYLIAFPNSFNFVPLVTTLSASVLTWLQVKQHQELSQSYAVAANDINLILSQVPYIDSEDKFEIFVADSENAFSREHTLWIARKDVLTYKN